MRFCVATRRQPVRVLIVDDHLVVRRGLRHVLADDAGIEFVGEAANGSTALRLAEELQPDVVLVDVMLPGLNGIEVTRRLVRQRRGAVLVVSAYNDRRTVQRILRAGATGFLPKTTDLTRLLSAIHAVARGERVIASEISDVLHEGSSDEDPLDRLSTREVEILQRIGEGETTPEIARALSIDRTTVDSHRRRIMRKLGLRSHAALARFALQERLTF